MLYRNVLWTLVGCVVCLANGPFASAAPIDGLADLRRVLRAHGADAAAVDSLQPDHPIVEDVRGKTLKKHRVTVPGSDAFYFASDEQTVVIVTASPSVVGHYVMPSVRGAPFVTLNGGPIGGGEVLDESVVYSVTDLGWFWLEPRITLTPAEVDDRKVTGAQIDETDVRHRLRVTGDADTATKGTGDFATLTAAMHQAEALLRRGEGVKISVAPGIYREGEIELWSTGWSEAGRRATLIIEGEGDVAPVITGGDNWSGGWEAVEGADGVYRKPWPYRFGLSSQTWDRWGYLIDPRVARSEVMIVDGQIMLPTMIEQFAWVDPDGAVPLEETAESANVPGAWKALGLRDLSALMPGSFAVVEAQGMIYAYPPEGVAMNDARVEVSVRPFLLGIHDRENVVLRNLNFRHAATFVGSHTSAVGIQASNVLVEDCRFDEHGSRAFGIKGEKPRNVTIRRTTFNGNGWQGFAVGYRADNYIIEDCESSYNNWRGHTGLQHGWDAAGAKAFALDGQIGMAIRRHRSFANLTNGFWLDQSFTPRSPIEISDSMFIANRFGSQLYLEKLTGPVDVRRNVIWNNVGTRAIDGTSWNVNLANNVLYTSSDGNAAIYLHRRGLESEYANYSENWSIHDNLIVSDVASGSLLYDDCSPEQFDSFLATLESDANVYYTVEPDNAFHLPGGMTGNLARWQSVSDQDQHSFFADPEFRAASNFDWSIGSEHVASALPDLPAAMSSKDREKLEYAIAQASRFLSITAAAGHESGPAFELARSAVENHWRPIDLSAVANRPFVGDQAWIGAGNRLPHLEAGRHVFAGVPFDVPDASSGSEVGIALRSNKVNEHAGKPIVALFELPIGRTTPAVYVLHGAGWIGDETEPAAIYELVYADGSTHPVTVRPFNTGVAEPNIGEWYHAFPVFDNAVARHVSLAAHGQSPGATLYVMEVTNPHPNKKVDALRLQSKPGRDTTVIVVGVTALTQ